MILVIDDDEEINYCMYRMCKKISIESIQARNYEYAFEILKAHSINLIICDMVFGNDYKGGLKFLDLIKEKSLNIPVIIVSGVINTTIVEKAIKKGAVAFIPKPISKEQIKKLYTEVGKTK